MSHRSLRSPRRLLAAAVAATLLVGACGYDETAVEPPESAATDQGGGTTPDDCDDATTSYAPSDDRAAARAQLLDRDRLVVGVSADTFRLGAADPFKNSAIEGFDIDVARAIAEALGVSLELRVINAAERIPLLGADPEKQEQEIDLVARNMTMNCTRWEQIGFSAVYYSAAQKVLVRKDDAAAFDKTGVRSLTGKRVCAPAGSTSFDNIETELPGAEPVSAGNHTGCLIKFQNGDVDAITGDDTVLAGLVAQDAYAVVPEQKDLSEEPYGIGANEDDVELIRFINSVLEQRRRNGEWQASYDKWLKPYLGDARPPAPTYGRQ